MRYENKFVFDRICYMDIVKEILASSALFREIYYKRQINNIYLDTIDYANYYANIMGEQTRMKQRIRWYSNTLKANNPILEYKIKFGELGKKEYYDMPNLMLDNTFCFNTYLKQIEDSARKKDDRYINMYNEIAHLLPTLYNTYERVYYISADGKYRITIDDNMKFNTIGTNYNQPFSFSSDDIVLELKYDNEDRAGATKIMQEFPFRLSRNSKYVNGISGLYF